MDDLIRRQDAINLVNDHTFYDDYDDTDKNCLIDGLRSLPSAQPEIIRCKDCKYAKWNDERGDYICNGRAVWENHYCGYAKRKGEENDIV